PDGPHPARRSCLVGPTSARSVMILKAPFELPPGFLTAFGYPHARRYVALFWERCGDEACYHDGVWSACGCCDNWAYLGFIHTADREWGCTDERRADRTSVRCADEFSSPRRPGPCKACSANRLRGQFCRREASGRHDPLWAAGAGKKRPRFRVVERTRRANDR